MKMSASLGKSFGLSSGEEDSSQKQGIVSILGSDAGGKSASLRRTLSADMSSKKWLAQNGFIKKTASTHQFPLLSSSPSSDGQSEECQEKEGNRQQEGDDGDRPGQFDLWTSIIQSQTPKQLPPPYIHPLVKRSSSSLSEKSLEICTESLGSETGSDVFSSYTPSETEDGEEAETEVLCFDKEEFQFVKQSYSNTTTTTATSSVRRSTLPRTFPPPLPSLTRGNATPSLRVQPHRLDGRLVLEAVAVPPRNYFHASREGGRLLLSFVHNYPSEDPDNEDVIDDEEEESIEVFGNEDDQMHTHSQEEEEEEEEADEGGEVEMENGIMIGQFEAPNLKLSSGVINFHRSALVRARGIENMNSTWTRKFSKAVNVVGMEVEMDMGMDDEEEEVATARLPQSLPPVARLISSGRALAAATSLNAYEYFWRTKPGMASLINIPAEKTPTALDNKCSKFILSSTNCPASPKPYGKQEMVLLRGNRADYLVPLSNRGGCKEPRRSLLIWEPCCIATS